MDFSEEQKINSQLMLILFLAITLITTFGAGISVYDTYKETGSVVEIIWVPVFMMVVMALVYYMIFQSTLETRSDNEGFSYRYPPSIRKTKIIPWGEIISWEIRHVKSIFEFGGFGYHRDLFRKKITIILGRKDVVFFIDAAGKSYIFSTDDPYNLTSALRKRIPEKENIHGERK